MNLVVSYKVNPGPWQQLYNILDNNEKDMDMPISYRDYLWKWKWGGRRKRERDFNSIFLSLGFSSMYNF